MATSTEEQLGVISDLVDLASGSGAPLPSFGDLGEKKAEGAVFRDQPLPGDADAPTIDLSEEQREEFVREVLDKLDAYDQAMRRRNEVEDKINKAYNLVPDPTLSGSHPDSTQLASELMLGMVDQVSARLASGILANDPIFRVAPIQGIGEEMGRVADLAMSSQRFANNYLRYGIGFEEVYRPANRRLCRVGTAVFRVYWKTKTEKISFWGEGGGEETKVRETGGVEMRLVPNDLAVIWPPTLPNWQKGYEMVGERVHLSRSEWRREARRLGLSTTEADELIERYPTNDPSAEKTMAFSDIEQPRGEKGFDNVQLTNLWCDMILPGEDEPSKFQIILHEKSRRLFYIGPNPYHIQGHDYFPVRFKLKDGTGWGDGVGHEALNATSLDAMLRNLSLDNLLAGAYNLTQVPEGSMADVLFDQLRPGQQVPVAEGEEIKSISLGGSAEGIQSERMDNRYSAREATGFASVLQGQGDPTQKSGTGTGATLALIEQASNKFDDIAAQVKMDLSAIARWVLELVAQYAPDGVFFNYATKEDAAAFKTMRYMPPRGRIGELFHVWAEAPSIASSNEARKQNYLVVWKFALEHLQLLEQQAVPLLMQENPAAITRMKHQTIRFMNSIARRVIEHHDLPGIPELLPEMPEPLPQDEIVNQLLEENQQLQQTVQQLQQMFAAHQQMLSGGQGMEGGVQ